MHGDLSSENVLIKFFNTPDNGIDVDIKIIDFDCGAQIGT